MIPSYVPLLTMRGLILAAFLMSTVAAQDLDFCVNCLLHPCFSARSVWTTSWAVGLSFVILWHDAWGSANAHGTGGSSFHCGQLLHAAFWKQLLYAAFFGPIAPFANLSLLIKDVAAYRVLVKSLSNLEHARRRPSKEVAKIITSCQVLVGTSEGKISETHGEHKKCYDTETFTNDETVLILGTRITENSYMVELDYKGKEALLRSNVLPGSERLELLLGTGTIARVLAGVQNLGFIWGVIVRAGFDLPVTPLEIIGVSHGMLVLLHSVSHFVVATSHRRLIVYLNGDQQEDVLKMCGETESDDRQYNQKLKLWKVFSVLFCLILLGLLYALIWHSHDRSIVYDFPLVMVAFLTFINSFYFHILVASLPMFADYITALNTIFGIVTGISMILSLVVTVIYWYPNLYCIRTSTFVHIWPYIG